jgi:hypothetical protein
LFISLPFLGAVGILLLPVLIFIAMTADILAACFGSVLRAVVSWTALFLAGGLIIGLVIGGDSLVVMPLVMGVTGLLLGLVLGFLCGPIFRDLPEDMDRKLGIN